MGNLLLALPALLDRVLGAVLPDPAARAKAITDVLGELASLDKGQMAVNAEEAKHSSIFVAGWRPFIGWCCGFAVAYQYVITPLALWGAAIGGVHLPTPPRLDDMLWELMFGVLGLGALRSFEKVKGVAK